MNDLSKPELQSREFRVFNQRHGRKKHGLSSRQAKRLSKQMLRQERAAKPAPAVH